MPAHTVLITGRSAQDSTAIITKNITDIPHAIPGDREWTAVPGGSQKNELIFYFASAILYSRINKLMKKRSCFRRLLFKNGSGKARGLI